MFEFYKNSAKNSQQVRAPSQRVSAYATFSSEIYLWPDRWNSISGGAFTFISERKVKFELSFL